MARYTKDKSKWLDKTSTVINKRGKLKGKNKKETKILKEGYLFHRVTRKGKLKPTIMHGSDGDGKSYCIDSVTGKSFPADFIPMKEQKKIIKDMQTLNYQNEYLSVATNAGAQVQDYTADVAVMLSKYKKVSKNLQKKAKKEDMITKNKKKKSYSGSSAYGSWGSGKR